MRSHGPGEHGIRLTTTLRARRRASQRPYHPPVRILLVARGADHASSRVRGLQYVEPLERLGHEVRTLRWEPAGRSDVARLTATALRDARWADATMIVKPRLHPATRRTRGEAGR